MISPAGLFDSVIRCTLHNGDFLCREAVELVHQLVYLRFQGGDIGGGIGSFLVKHLSNEGVLFFPICNAMSQD